MLHNDYVVQFAQFWVRVCNSTVTKILKRRCGLHTPEGPRDLATTPRDRTGIRAVVDLHEQSICQTPYNLHVVPVIALNLITSML